MPSINILWWLEYSFTGEKEQQRQIMSLRWFNKGSKAIRSHTLARVGQNSVQTDSQRDVGKQDVFIPTFEWRT